MILIPDEKKIVKLNGVRSQNSNVNKLSRIFHRYFVIFNFGRTNVTKGEKNREILFTF